MRNNLPENIRKASNLLTFKTSLKTHLDVNCHLSKTIRLSHFYPASNGLCALQAFIIFVIIIFLCLPLYVCDH